MLVSDGPYCFFQIRNALMVCGLFATACAYIGARALPDLLLNDAYSINLDKLAVSATLPVLQRPGCSALCLHSLGLDSCLVSFSTSTSIDWQL